ncbi:MAG: OprD family outer membrane porin, partial [Pseudomonas sp.]|nr:OprD family outer membrane porin [Pseudomonas sp.]
MLNKTKLSLAVFSAIVSAAPLMAAAEEQAEGFVEGSSFNILNRNFYMNRDFRKGQSSPTDNGYTEVWAHGIIGKFESGFTQGTVGFGIDAFAMLGLKLDTGDGRYGPGGTVNMLPVNSDGEAEDDYSKVGGAVKARVLDTVVKVGDVFP